MVDIDICDLKLHNSSKMSSSPDTSLDNPTDNSEITKPTSSVDPESNTSSVDSEYNQKIADILIQAREHNRTRKLMGLLSFPVLN